MLTHCSVVSVSSWELMMDEFIALLLGKGKGSLLSSSSAERAEHWSLSINKSTKASVFQETFLSSWNQGLCEGIQRNLWICFCVCDAHPQDRNKWIIKLFLVSWEGQMVAELPPLPSTAVKRGRKSLQKATWKMISYGVKIQFINSEPQTLS